MTLASDSGATSPASVIASAFVKVMSPKSGNKKGAVSVTKLSTIHSAWFVQSVPLAGAFRSIVNLVTSD